MKTPKPGRVTILPPSKTLKDILATCDRHIRNSMHVLMDCADCQDCSEDMMHVVTRNSAEWAELRMDVAAMIEKEKKKKAAARKKAKEVEEICR